MNSSAPIEPKSPPSTYAIAALVDGEQGALLRVAELTAVRAAMIGVGLWFAGLRHRQLVAASASASLAVTVILGLDYRARARRAAGVRRRSR